MRSEAAYQRRLMSKLSAMFPGSYIFKNPAEEVQGIPDLLILFEDKWAMLEVKLSGDAEVQPNQAHYINEFNHMSFAAFIYPENEQEVLGALQSAFRS